MWLLADEDTKIYIFGTVHVLPENSFTPEGNVLQALNSAKTLIIETPIYNEQGRRLAVQAIEQHGRFGPAEYSPYSKFSEMDRSELEAALLSAGWDLDSALQYKPFMLGTLLLNDAFRGAGYSFEWGADYQLMEIADQAGKTFASMESSEDAQLIMNSATIDDQVIYLMGVVRSLNRVPELMTSLQHEWEDGDDDGIMALTIGRNAPFCLCTDDLYDKLLTQRNERWATRLEAILGVDGTYFVAVGAGHLLGPNNLIDGLKQRGLQPERVQTVESAIP